MKPDAVSKDYVRLQGHSPLIYTDGCGGEVQQVNWVCTLKLTWDGLDMSFEAASSKKSGAEVTRSSASDRGAADNGEERVGQGDRECTYRERARARGIVLVSHAQGTPRQHPAPASTRASPAQQCDLPTQQEGAAEAALTSLTSHVVAHPRAANSGAVGSNGGVGAAGGGVGAAGQVVPQPQQIFGTCRCGVAGGVAVASVALGGSFVPSPLRMPLYCYEVYAMKNVYKKNMA